MYIAFCYGKRQDWSLTHAEYAHLEPLKGMEKVKGKHSPMLMSTLYPEKGYMARVCMNRTFPSVSSPRLIPVNQINHLTRHQALGLAVTEAYCLPEPHLAEVFGKNF